MRYVLGLISTLTWLFYSVAYVFRSTVGDHTEASVAAQAIAWHNGQPLYDSVQALYTPLYGPVLFVANRIHLLLSPDILATGKLLGILASGVGLFVIFRVARRRVELPDSVFVTGFFATALMAFGTYPISVRGDGLLFLFVSLSVLLMDSVASNRKVGGLGPFLLGALVGLAMGVKVTAAFYFLPAAAVLLGKNFQLRRLIYAAIGGVLFLTVPFLLFDALDPTAYFEVIMRATSHPKLIAKGLGVLAWVGIFLLPMIATLLIRTDFTQWWAFYRWPVGAFGVGLLLLTLSGSKIGAGAHHAMPLIPVVAWIWSGALGTPRPGLGRTRTRVLISVSSLMLAALFVFSVQKIQQETTTLDSEITARAISEIEMILVEEYPNSIAMGYGGDYRLSFLRSWVLAEGHPYTLDSGVLMDLDLLGAGVDRDMLEFFRSCGIDRWIIPRGATPFQVRSYYGEYGSGNVFGPDLGRVFGESYELLDTHSIFEVWGCRQSAGSQEATEFGMTSLSGDEAEIEYRMQER